MKATLLLAALVLLPLATALPIACSGECRVVATSTGYDPAVVTIATGASLVWHSEDITHVQRDQNVGAGAAACFEVVSAQGEDSPAVRFDLAGTSVTATVDGVTTRCGTAVATPAGAVVPYFCSIHPTMRAAIVVVG